MSKLAFVGGLVALLAVQGCTDYQGKECTTCLAGAICYPTSTFSESDCKIRSFKWCGDGAPAPATPPPVPATPEPPVGPSTPEPPVVPNTPEPPVPVPPSTDKKLVVYYESWATYGRAFQVYDMDWTTMTHVNFAFADIKNGNVIVGDKYADVEKSMGGACPSKWDSPLAGNLGCLIQMKKAYPNVKTMISVGGWTWSKYFSDAAKTPATRKKFAESAAEYMRKYEFDGLDLDWEYPVAGGLPPCGASAQEGTCNNYAPEDRENYVLLLNACRAAIPAGAPLTIASTPAPQKLNDNHELDKLAQVLDWVNIMTYDYNGGWQTFTGHNAPLYSNPESLHPTFAADVTVSLLLEGRDPKKFVFGMGTYGRAWEGVTDMGSLNGMHMNATGALKPGTHEAGSYDYKDLVANYINKQGYVRHWDAVSQVPFLTHAQQGKVISYDDIESIEIKSNYACHEKQMAGGMIWAASSDTKTNSLQARIYDICVMGNKAPSRPDNTPNPSPPAPTPSPDTPDPNAPASPTPAPVGNAYNPATIYNKGDRCTHNGATYEAKWYTQGTAPGGAWGPWKMV